MSVGRRVNLELAVCGSDGDDDCTRKGRIRRCGLEIDRSTEKIVIVDRFNTKRFRKRASVYVYVNSEAEVKPQTECV